MKKKIWISAVSAAVFCGGASVGVQASGMMQRVQAYVNKGLSITVNGEKWQAKDNKDSALYPLTYQNRTYLPARALANAYGLKVEWNPKRNAISVNRKKPQTDDRISLKKITEKNMDLTGDGKPETVQVWGHPFRMKNGTAVDGMYDSALLQIQDGGTGQTQMLTVNDTIFEPAVAAADLTGDQVPDLFFNAPTPSNGGFESTHLFTFANGRYQEIALPKASVAARLADNYKAQITDTVLQQETTIDIRDKKAEYDDRGVYQDGKLLKNIDLMIEPVALYKIAKLPDGSNALQGYMSIDGLYQADGIADVVLTWRRQGGEWVETSSKVTKKGQ